MALAEKDCFSCKYQNIVETSHEWIDCFCQLTGKKCSPIKWEDCQDWELHPKYADSEEDDKCQEK